MIAQLRGTLVEHVYNIVILDVGGVGYAVTVSGKTQAQLGLADPAVRLLTEMIVREDSMTLFGFLEPEERDAFRLLTTVQGVGAKAALAILSVLSPRGFRIDAGTSKVMFLSVSTLNMCLVSLQTASRDHFSAFQVI